MIDWRRHLESTTATCGGELRAKGTRVLVTHILDSRSDPSLRPEHVDAAIACGLVPIVGS